MDLEAWFEADADRIRHNLNRYFAGAEGDLFTGRWFEHWRTLSDPNRFEAADLLAVEALSVQVPPEAAADLVSDAGERFHDLLDEIPIDVPLWEVPAAMIEAGSPADRLHREVDEQPGIGWVTAGKLLAAKRPHLLPVYDQSVKELLNPNGGPFWEPMRDLLVNQDIRKVIEATCSIAPPNVTLLRRIDVALWMHATQDLTVASDHPPLPTASSASVL